MKLKTTLTALTVALCLFHVPAQAGIPVFDEVANASNIQQWAEKLQQWQQTVQHYQSQMNAYKQQLATATGIRDVQAFLNQAKNLTADIKNLKNRGISLNDLLTGSGGSYAGELNRLYDKYKLFDNCRRTPARRTGIAANRCSSIRRCPSRTLLTSRKKFPTR